MTPLSSFIAKLGIGWPESLLVIALLGFLDGDPGLIFISSLFSFMYLTTIIEKSIPWTRTRRFLFFIYFAIYIIFHLVH